MALPVFSPAINRTRKAITSTSQRAILKLVPEIESGKTITNRSFTILVTFAMILVAMVFVGACGAGTTWLLGQIENRAMPWRKGRVAV